MNTQFDLKDKPLARALITSAVRAMDLNAAPMTHRELLQRGITLAAQEISDSALLLLGRNSIASYSVLPGDAPVVIGFSLFIMLGIIQVLGKEGITVEVEKLTEQLIERHLQQKIAAAGNDPAAKKEINELSRIAAQIPGQIVETAQGEVEELFSRCYSVVAGYIQGGDEARLQILPIFGTALHVLLQAQVEPTR